ncbi:unnamed protein product [Pedinophyceae sp. YPF-701]|nr:unnamed protein product [Pedinophyceae sp. YPF-701]
MPRIAPSVEVSGGFRVEKFGTPELERDEEALPIGYTAQAPAALRRGESDIERFAIKDSLGQGPKSRLFSAQDPISEVDVALKVVPVAKLSAQERKQLRREVLIQSSLSHTGILALYGALRTASHYVMILELARKDLRTVQARRAMARAKQVDQGGAVRLEMDAREVTWVMTTVAGPLAEALEYLATRNVIHRDLKPENILIGGDGYLKLCDFGYAIVPSDQQRPVTRLGTVEFMAPEVVTSGVHPTTGNVLPRDLRTPYGFACDVWSYGVTIFELLHGITPFGHLQTRQEILHAVSNDATLLIQEKMSPDLPRHVQALLRACLQPDAQARPNSADLFTRFFFTRASDSFHGTASQIGTVQPSTPLLSSASRSSTKTVRILSVAQRASRYPGRSFTDAASSAGSGHSGASGASGRSRLAVVTSRQQVRVDNRQNAPGCIARIFACFGGRTREAIHPRDGAHNLTRGAISERLRKAWDAISAHGKTSNLSGRSANGLFPHRNAENTSVMSIQWETKAAVEARFAGGVCAVHPSMTDVAQKGTAALQDRRRPSRVSFKDGPPGERSSHVGRA